MFDWVTEAESLWAPPPKLTVSEWADAERMLSREASAEPGRWITARVPYQRGIMDALNDPAIESIVVMSSAQVGKTEIILNVIGYYVSQDPSPILALQPTLQMAMAFSKDRLAPMIRDTDCLTGKVKESRSRDSGNTLLHKQFPGGHITLAGANSPASLASRPIRIVLCDEIDRYPISAGTEGDPVSLAFKRTTTFWNRKALMVSTPTVKDVSRIENAYDNSDRRRFWLPCSVCGKLQTLKWSQIKNIKPNPYDCFYECEHCESHLTDGDKPEMLAKGEWIAEKPGGKVAGFHLSELYSPWVSWGDMAAGFLKANQGGRETLRVFVNTSLGETWEEQQGDQVASDGLISRREQYPAQIPRGAVLLVAGIDVQDNRLEASLWGFGPGEESWVIEHKVFIGDPGAETVWDDLDSYLNTTFEHESGVKLRITAAAIDSGGSHTESVYRYVKSHENRRFWAVKGSNQAGRPLVSRPTRSNRGKVLLWAVGTDTAKDLLFSRLKIDHFGRGYVHLSDKLDEEYCLQLVSEKSVTKFKKGIPYREYVKTRPRNEALDCGVYALAALATLNPDLDLLAKKLEAEAEKLDKTPEPVEQHPLLPPPKKPGIKRKTSGWVNSWKK